MNFISEISFPKVAVFMAFFLAVHSDLVEVENVSKVRPGGSKVASGIVYGARSCGGKGKFIQWRIDGCKTTDSICEFPTNGQTHKSEFTFVPSQTANQLGIKVTAAINGSEPMIVEDHPLEDSMVIGGVEQTIHITSRIPKEYKGSMLTGQVEFYTVDEKLVEICEEADVILV